MKTTGRFYHRAVKRKRRSVNFLTVFVVGLAAMIGILVSYTSVVGWLLQP